MNWLYWILFGIAVGVFIFAPVCSRLVAWEEARDREAWSKVTGAKR